MSKPTNKREPCKLNKKEKETSSKIVVWCVRCPPRTVWQVHRRFAQHSPRFATQPQHTSHPTTETSKQASQAKPHQKHTQHKTSPQSRRHLPPRAASFSDSPAVPWSNCSFTQQHIQTNAQTLKKMLLLSPSPSPLPCLGDVKTNKQKGTLQAK